MLEWEALISVIWNVFRTDQHAKDSRIQIKLYTKFQASESISQSGQILDKLYSNFNGALFAF